MGKIGEVGKTGEVGEIAEVVDIQCAAKVLIFKGADEDRSNIKHTEHQQQDLSRQ